MMKLKVHLHQRLLHVLDMGCRVFDEPFPLAQIGPQRSYLCFGAILLKKSAFWMASDFG